MRASGTRRWLECHRSVLSKAGAPCSKEHGKSPGGNRTTFPQTRDDRVQGSTGSMNARWRREFPGGDTEEPEADTFRGSAEKADREQLNDERGIKPLPVNHRRDRAESVQPDQGG